MVKQNMRAMAIRWMKRLFALVFVATITLLAVRVWDTQRGPPLHIWHTYVPHELSAKELDSADWTKYLEAEARIFESLRQNVSQQLDPEDRVPVNRYFSASPVYPAHFARDWNRSYTLEPEGTPAGAVVLLHGLTDTPYSLRHIARLYRDHGFVVIAIRLPAHGTVPAALTDIEWETWEAATRLAVREARRRIDPSSPLHLVGFSMGGALALRYALDAIGDRELRRPDRLVLICLLCFQHSQRPHGSACCLSLIHSNTIRSPSMARGSRCA
jgi:predicted alpha/beta-fold hydrolase